MIKIAVPILMNGTFLGTAGGCGRLPAGGEVESFIIEKTTGLSEAKIVQLCADLAFMTEAQTFDMAKFIESRIAEYVYDNGQKW